MKKFILQLISIIIISIGLVLMVKAWTEPPYGGTCSNPPCPPGGNAPAPLNVSSAGQSKAGGLILNTGGAATGLIVQNGNVGIGTAGPGAKLHVAGEAYFTYSGGEARIRDGSGFQIWNPEGTGNEVRLGAAWNKPGIYSNGDMFIGSESRIIINDNNQENFSFDAQYFSGRGKQILDVGDSWLRLNQAGQFGSGVYTPGLLRADGDIFQGGQADGNRVCRKDGTNCPAASASGRKVLYSALAAYNDDVNTVGWFTPAMIGWSGRKYQYINVASVPVFIPSGVSTIYARFFGLASGTNIPARFRMCSSSSCSGEWQTSSDRAGWSGDYSISSPGSGIQPIDIQAGIWTTWDGGAGLYGFIIWGE